MTKLYTNECLYKDVYTIIEMMNPDMRNKINKKFIDFLKENQNVQFEGTINKDIPIKNQNLREEIKIMLSMIYINYFCTEDKKIEILTLDNDNINKFYNTDIFKKNEETIKTDVIDKKNESSTLEIIEYKENFLKRVFRKIKIWFNRRSE